MSGERAKKRRLGSGQACTDCRNRKHRCDGGRPICGSCRSRSVQCVYPGKVPDPTAIEALDLLPTAGHRMTQEDLNLHEAGTQLPQLPISTPNAEQGKLHLLWKATSDISRSPGQDIVPRVTQTYSAREGRCRGAGEIQSGKSSASSPTDSGGPDGYFGRSSTFAFLSEVPLRSEHDHDVQVNGKQQMPPQIRQGIYGPATSTQISTENEHHYILPNTPLAYDLIDAYFDRVHPLYPFVHEGTFRTEYERIESSSVNPRLSPTWYAVLNMIFASSCEFCDTIPESQLMQTVAPFVARSRDIIFSHIFKCGNLELVQALLLMCHFLQGTMELNECWTLAGLMTRTAVSIGLHLSPDDLPISIVEKEVRKRVWWGCFILDRTLSWKFGRPISMQAANVVEVPPPLAIDDQYIQNTSLAPRQPLARPPILAFFLHTIKLAQIIDQILQVLYTTTNERLQQPGVDSQSRPEHSLSYLLSEAVLLDGQLQAWWQDRPKHLHPTANTSDSRIFQRQQTVMQLRYLQIRILLQRQLLLYYSRHDIGDRFLRSIVIAGSQTCITAAKDTIRLIYMQYRRKLLNSLRYNLHYIFTSMGVLLHLYSMDKSKLQLLEYEQEDEILKWGMEFLTAAGSTSTLAARYATLLQEVRSRTSIHGSLRNTEIEDTSGLLSTITNGPVPPQPPVTPLASQPRQTVFSEREEIDLDGMNFDDLLFGTGLPQDILPFDYLSNGFNLLS